MLDTYYDEPETHERCPWCHGAGVVEIVEGGPVPCDECGPKFAQYLASLPISTADDTEEEVPF